MRDPDAPAYVSEKKLERSDTADATWHVDEDCYQVEAMDEVVEMTVAEAREKCARQAQCCSTMPALEDLN